MRQFAAWYVAIPLEIAQVIVAAIAAVIRQARLIKRRTYRRARCVKPVLFVVVCAVLIITLLRPDIAADVETRLTPLKKGVDIFRERTEVSLLDADESADAEKESYLQFGSDGMVRGWDDVHEALENTPFWHSEKRKLKEAAARHPIEDLIQRGQQHWRNLLARQSRTLPEAVVEYTRRYGRAPPKGFEKWWEFCKRHNVRIVDDYDQIDSDIAPFFALSPKMFNDRVEAVKATQHSFHIHLDPYGPSSVSGDRATATRAPRFLGLIEPIAQYLPGPITFTVSDHDLGSWILGDDLRNAALKAVGRGKFLTENILKSLEKKNRNEYSGLTAACPRNAPAWVERQSGRPKVYTEEKGTTFIHNASTTYDFCYNSDLLHQHGALSIKHERDSALRPIFQQSKFSRNPEFLTTPLDAYENATTAATHAHTLSWDAKTENKVLWRGSTTGDSYSKRKDYDWRNSHRPRLVMMANAQDGERDIWVKRGNVWKLESWPLDELNAEWLDVALASEPHQCNKADGTCEEMAKELTQKPRVPHDQAAKYKYLIDVDGNGWSSRFHRLLHSGSLVFKATIYPEWNTQWLTPWVHYVPIQVDYSDLYNVMSFFAGPPDNPSAGHEVLARQIAEQGKYFAEHFWRWEDMQAYMFRLLLEYRRLTAEDRTAASYDGNVAR